jgi:hypothetical protein
VALQVVGEQGGERRDGLPFLCCREWGPLGGQHGHVALAWTRRPVGASRQRSRPRTPVPAENPSVFLNPRRNAGT